jgi:MSHA biogenesis protein MshJ
MNKLFEKFNALGRRERVGMALALVALVYVVFDATLLGPQTKRHKVLKTELAGLEQELSAVRSEMVVVKVQFDKDPQAKDRAQLDVYKKAMDEADAFIRKVESDPQQVGALLRQILTSTPGVTLVALKTLPAVAVVEPKGAKTPGAKTVYRRGIEVTVKGNYLAMLPYLEKIQNSPTRVLWAEADLDVGIYPDSTLKLVVFTLSSEPEARLG